MSNEKNVISVDFGSVCGRIGPMHAVNNGPICKLPPEISLKSTTGRFELRVFLTRAFTIPRSARATEESTPST